MKCQTNFRIVVSIATLVSSLYYHGRILERILISFSYFRLISFKLCVQSWKVACEARNHQIHFTCSVPAHGYILSRKISIASEREGRRSSRFSLRRSCRQFAGLKISIRVSTVAILAPWPSVFVNSLNKAQSFSNLRSLISCLIIPRHYRISIEDLLRASDA